MIKAKKNDFGGEKILLPHFPRLVYNALRSDGLSEAMLFDGFDFGAQELCDDQYRLSVSQHEQFMLRVFELTGDIHYALQLIQSEPSTFESIVSLAAQRCENIADAIAVVARYLKIVTRVFSVEVISKRESMSYAIESNLNHNDVTYFAISAFALLTDQMICEATGGLQIIDRVEVCFKKPVGFNSIASRFPFAWSFDKPKHRILFKQQYLNHRVQKLDLISNDLIAEMAERQLREAEAEAGNNIVIALATLLESNLASPPSSDVVAKALGQSPRSLRRKLKSAGTSYQTELDRLRLRFASRKLLHEQDLPITQIAYQLGYSNVSDFGRAFKKWSGLSPRAYRARSEAQHR